MNPAIRALAATVVLWAALQGPALASTVVLIPPVDAAVVRSFEDPASRYGAGHRGVDYATAAGTPVRAAAAGTVRFAGSVAGTLAVSIQHPGDVVTTYTALQQVHVSAGTVVGQGHWIGLAGRSHPGGAEGLHFGVKLRGDYVDPRTLMAPIDLGRALHLAPLAESFERDLGAMGAAALRHRDEAPCTPAPDVRAYPPAPNDNVVVVVAGIASQTAGGELPELYGSYASRALGYPARRVYEFSYKGVGGPGLHRTYRRADTYGDIRLTATRLSALLERISQRHPKRDVDVVAHSQGGVVARAALTELADGPSGTMPRVQHLVTLASPHQGTPAADIATSPTVPGRLARLGWWLASQTLPVPPPGVRAVQQMGTASELTSTLAREDVAFGTRVLTLAMAHDLVVPAGRAAMAHEAGSVLAPEGMWGHTSILRSEAARALAYGFLRDRLSACPPSRTTSWWQRAVGGLWAGAAGLLGR